MGQDQKDATKIYDILVFGATGYTGKHVVEELMSLKVRQDDPARLGNKVNFRFAIAGRNKTKLEELVTSLKKKFPSFDESVDCLEADVSDLEKISQATEKAKVVISCVGPYRLYGEPIVEACILSGTHYVDITGEPYFVEDMFCKYNEEARRKDIMIVHYCGFDSVPADMGSLMVKKKLVSDGFRPLSIEMFVTFSSESSKNVVNYATYHSAIIAMTSKKPSRKEIRSKLAKTVTYGPEPTFSVLPRTKENIDGYYTPFPAADPLVVKMGQQITETYPDDKERYFGNDSATSVIPPAKVASYFVFKELKSSLFALCGGMIVAFLGKFSWGKSFLLEYPHLVTFGAIQPSGSGGPSREDIEKGSFSVKIIGKGARSASLSQNLENKGSVVPDTEISATFSGPDPGYFFTSKSVMMAGLTILKERVYDERQLARGVLTPSAAFGNTSFIEKLQALEPKVKLEFAL